MAPTEHQSDAQHTVSFGERLRKRFNLKRLLIIIVCTYLGVTMVVGFLQARLIYFPSRVLEATPADVGLEYEDVKLKTSDGVTICAWYVPHRSPKADIIFFHGNAGNISHRVAELKVLNHLGYNVLIVDYRGYGQSEGHPGEKGTYRDADAAWTYVTETRGVPANRVVLLGESLGGAVAIDLASRTTPAALVVQSTFTSLVDIGSIHYPLLPVRLILQHRYESIYKIAKVKCPKLFFHSAEDSLVPLSNARALFEAASPPKEFIETPGEHNSGGFMYSDEFANQFAEFVDRVIGIR